MTNQQAYEKIRHYLTREGAVRAWDDEKCNCAYTAFIGGEVHHCAVGCLLTEETAKALGGISMAVASLTGVDGTTIDYLHGDHMQAVATARTELADLDIGFLEEVQAAHDDENNWFGFDRERGVWTNFDVDVLDSIAQKYHLTVPVPS